MGVSQTAFYPSLEALCTKFLVVGPKQPLALEAAQFPAKMAEQQRSLFEQFLLFDTIAIKIRGENIPLILLLRFFGERGLEELIDQGAIKFVQWKPTVFHMVTEMPGVDALASGNLNSAAYDDPEQSIELAFKWLSEPPSRHTKRLLKRKAAPLYEHPPADSSAKAVTLTKSAYNSGKLRPFNLAPNDPFDRLPLPKRALLNDCASELLEYSFALGQGMTSLSSYAFLSLFTDSVDKLKRRPDLANKFSELAKLESFPDLKLLYPQLSNPLLQLPKLRGKRSSQKFRQWLAETTEDKAELTTAYIASIANARGPLDTTKGKFLKTVVMTAIGMAAGVAIGAAADTALGLAAGAIAAKVADPAADMGLDLLDQFVIEGLAKGWSPRMFFDDLKELERRDLRAGYVTAAD